MYINRSLNHKKIFPTLFLGTLIIGVFLGLFLPFAWTKSVFQILATTSFRIMLYFTIPYLFFSLLISSYELIKTHHFLSIIKLITKSGILISTLVVGLSIVIFIFLPNQNIFSLISQQTDIQRISAFSIIKNIFTISLDHSEYASQVLIIPFFVLAIILGVNANNTIDSRHSFLEACNGLRAINLKILETIFPWYSLAILIMGMYNIASIRPFSHVEHFGTLLIFLPVLAIVLTFAVYPFLLKLYKIPIQYNTWCQQIIPAITLAFAGGNMTTASVSLLYVEDLNNPGHKVTDTVIAFSFVFARVGTAVTIALTYIMINKIYSAIPLSIVQLFIIFSCSILFSFIANAISTPIIITSIITLSKIPSIVVHELYLSILPLTIILHCLASVIDIATSGFIKLFIANKVHNVQSDFDLWNKN